MTVIILQNEASPTVSTKGIQIQSQALFIYIINIY